MRTEIKKQILLEFADRTCDNCVKASGSYYELKIQLRREMEFDPEKFEKIGRMIKKEAHHFSFDVPEARVFWVEENKDGVDFFFGSRKIGEAVLHKIREDFRVRAERSSTLVGLDKNGKKRFRMTYCVRA